MRMVRIPLRKQAIALGLERNETLRAIWEGGRSSKEEAGRASSAWLPTLTTQRVATAMASQSRVARSGSPILVACHCQPARLHCLKPDSIQLRIEYQKTSAWLGERSVTTSQGSLCSSSQQVSKVQASGLDLKQSPVPDQAWLVAGNRLAKGKNWLEPVLQKAAACFRQP